MIFLSASVGLEMSTGGATIAAADDGHMNGMPVALELSAWDTCSLL